MIRIKPQEIGPLAPELREVLKRQGYQIYGKSAYVKKCHWTHQRLKNNRNCFKRFYGINSHQCIQSTPTVICNFSCVFCWRTKHDDIGLGKNYTEEMRYDEKLWEQLYDKPEKVLEGLLWGWKRILSGYKPEVDEETWKEANNPKHVTFSLNGEPMSYPYMADLIRLIKEKGMTVFLVTNGSFPERIRDFMEKNSWPTQLYVTLPPPDKREFFRTFRPNNTKQWDKVMETLELLGQVTTETRKVARLTVAKHWNLIDAKGYAELIKKMKADFVEIKGVDWLGAARKRIKAEDSPTHEEVKAFAQELATYLGYQIVAEAPESAVIILTSGEKPLVIPGLEENAAMWEDSREAMEKFS